MTDIDTDIDTETVSETAIRLYGWTAHRSGPRMTIHARFLATGGPVKVSADIIYAHPHRPAAIAIDRRRGTTYLLFSDKP